MLSSTTKNTTTATATATSSATLSTTTSAAGAESVVAAAAEDAGSSVLLAGGKNKGTGKLAFVPVPTSVAVANKKRNKQYPKKNQRPGGGSTESAANNSKNAAVVELVPWPCLVYENLAHALSCGGIPEESPRYPNPEALVRVQLVKQAEELSVKNAMKTPVAVLLGRKTPGHLLATYCRYYDRDGDDDDGSSASAAATTTATTTVTAPNTTTGSPPSSRRSMLPVATDYLRSGAVNEHHAEYAGRVRGYADAMKESFPIAERALISDAGPGSDTEAEDIDGDGGGGCEEEEDSEDEQGSDKPRKKEFAPMGDEKAEAVDQSKRPEEEEGRGAFAEGSVAHVSFSLPDRTPKQASAVPEPSAAAATTTTIVAAAANPAAPVQPKAAEAAEKKNASDDGSAAAAAARPPKKVGQSENATAASGTPSEENLRKMISTPHLAAEKQSSSPSQEPAANAARTATANQVDAGIPSAGTSIYRRKTPGTQILRRKTPSRRKKTGGNGAPSDSLSRVGDVSTCDANAPAPSTSPESTTSTASTSSTERRTRGSKAKPNSRYVGDEYDTSTGVPKTAANPGSDKKEKSGSGRRNHRSRQLSTPPSKKKARQTSANRHGSGGSASSADSSKNGSKSSPSENSEATPSSSAKGRTPESKTSSEESMDSSPSQESLSSVDTETSMDSSSNGSGSDLASPSSTSQGSAASSGKSVENPTLVQNSAPAGNARKPRPVRRTQRVGGKRKAPLASSDASAEEGGGDIPKRQIPKRRTRKPVAVHPLKRGGSQTEMPAASSNGNAEHANAGVAKKRKVGRPLEHASGESQVLLPTFKDVSPLFVKAGYVFEGGVFCLPVVAGEDLENGRNRFESVRQFREHLCAFGVKGDLSVWSEQDKLAINKWVRYSIVTENKDDSGCMLGYDPVTSFWGYLKPLGFQYSSGRYIFPGIESKEAIDGINRFENDKGSAGLNVHVAKYGLPESCNFDALTQRQLRSLQVFYAESRDHDIL